MSEHVIHNPVPTPEQMAEMIGVSPARVVVLRSIMRSPTVPLFAQRKRSTGVSVINKASAIYRKTSVTGKTKDAGRGKTKAR